MCGHCKIKLETSQLQEGVTAKTATSFTIRLAASCGHNCTVAIVRFAALAIRLSASKVRGGFLTNELQAGLRAGLLICQAVSLMMSESLGCCAIRMREPSSVKVT